VLQFMLVSEIVHSMCIRSESEYAYLSRTVSHFAVIGFYMRAAFISYSCGLNHSITESDD